MGVEAVLICITSLMRAPCAVAETSPRPDVAEEYINCRMEHDKKAVECTELYARGSSAIAW
jgi:hypothetical protein